MLQIKNNSYISEPSYIAHRASRQRNFFVINFSFIFVATNFRKILYIIRVSVQKIKEDANRQKKGMERLCIVNSIV